MTSMESIYRLEALQLAAKHIPEDCYCPENVIADAEEYLNFLCPKDEEE